MKIHGTYRPESRPAPDNPLQRYSQNDGLVFLLRHGRIQGAGEKRFIGNTDMDLDDIGISQARYWRQALVPLTIDTIHTSGLTRCRHTAAIIAGDRTVTSHPELNEIHLGQWDGRPFEEIKQQDPNGFKQRGDHLDTFRPPGGESFLDLQNRVLPFFTQCLREPGTPLFVTHAGVIRMILCHITGLALKDLFQIPLTYGQLVVLERKRMSA
jgi:probable phosphoglycerate mutase